ncbi:sodium/potassium/calcium exchanger 1-like isoform X2 [Bolinopsis microptera]|uniref:sodium/potassium/calcium exchanger 1-like isoform X2 n=1 Tax=Bolinopsis microptera TaxID=2820187 RepID=UPI003079AABB
MTDGNSSSLTDCSWEYGMGGYYYVVMAIVYIIAIVILFIAIAVVCDDYFVPSLVVICQRLDLSEDVAGATFMAAGSSAPELFTSLAAVTNNSDIGVGTIVGSAVFNILIIISLSAILSKNVLLLDWRPLSRDAFFYGISIVMFSAFAWDGMFTWLESLVTLLYYGIYILALKFNPALFKLLDILGGCLCCIKDVPHAEAEEVENTKVHVLSDNSIGPVVQVTPPTDNNSSDVRVEMYPKGLGVPMTMMRTQSSGSSGIGSMTDDPPLHIEPEEKPWSRDPGVHKSESLDSVCVDDVTKTNGEARHSSSSSPGTDTQRDVINLPRDVTPPRDKSTETEGEEEDFDEVTVCCCEVCPKVLTSLPERPAGACSLLRYFINIFYFTASFPFQLLFSFTIPNTMKPHLKKYYLLSFVGSVLWIAVLSYGMVLLVERFGCIVGFNDYIMGLVVVAAGTSVPDALSSVIVAREGHGDMAVSNALGSNVFDINLGLGLPFLIKTLYNNGPLVLQEFTTDMVILPHAKFGIILLFILILVYILIFTNKFRLNRTVGIILFLMYFVFIAYSLVQELVCDGGRIC